MRLDNLIAVLVGLVLFFASWFVMGLAFNTTIPGVVFFVALLMMTAGVGLPAYVLDRLDRR
jgi:uncharacterized membrane protein